MSTKHCSNCGHANLPYKGIIAKKCEKCGHEFVKASFSVSITDTVSKSAATPSVHFDPNKFLTEKQRKIQAQRAAQRGEEVEEEYEGDGEEVDFDADSFKIKADIPQATTIKLGSLVEQKKGRRDDMYAREKGSYSQKDMEAMRKTLKSSRGNPTDIGE